MLGKVAPASPSVSTTAGSDAPTKERRRPTRAAALIAKGELRRLLSDERPPLPTSSESKRRSMAQWCFKHSVDAALDAEELQNRKRSDPLGDIDFDLVVEGSGKWLACTSCNTCLEVHPEVAQVYARTDNVNFLCRFLTGVACPGRKLAAMVATDALPEQCDIKKPPLDEETADAGGLGLAFDKTSTCSTDMAAAYDKWGSKYTAEVRSWGYSAPEKATEMLLAAFEASAASSTRAVLDAGCGSGLQSESMKAAGLGPLTGLDISEALLEEARATGRYAACLKTDLNAPLADHQDNSFDGGTCVGVLTYIDSSTSPNLLQELGRVVKPGGVVVFTSRTDKAEEWERCADGMEKAGIWKLFMKTEPLLF